MKCKVIITNNNHKSIESVLRCCQATDFVFNVLFKGESSSTAGMTLCSVWYELRNQFFISLCNFFFFKV